MDEDAPNRRSWPSPSWRWRCSWWAGWSWPRASPARQASPATARKKADTITGSIGADTINGRGGDDTIEGGNGNDTINGGGGNDTITDFDPGVPDVDTINGGKGDDVIDVREGDVNDAQDDVDCGPGTDTIFFDATDLRDNCEIFNPN